MITVVTFTSIINQLLPEPHAGLLSGILFGTKATMSKELTDALIRTGTLHIVALSGTNITILTGIINFSLLWLVGRKFASVLTILLITGFIWLVGSSPSVIRAGIMGGISLLAIIFGRQTWGLLAWMLAISTMLLLNPVWITDLSFQLSAMATLGIILFGGKSQTENQKLDHRISNFQRLTSFFCSLISDNLRLTLAAQVFTIPIIFWYFHRISLISPVTNLLIGWIVPPLTVLGLGTAVAGLVFWPLGQLLAWFAWVPLQYLITVVELTSRVPGASVGW